MKTYTGYRTGSLDNAGNPNTVVVRVHEQGAEPRTLDPCYHIRKHSPTGFEWGYGGSGPAQLALALAFDVLASRRAAQDVYQRLKFRLVGSLPREGWSLTEEQILAAIRQIQKEQR